MPANALTASELGSPAWNAAPGLADSRWCPRSITGNLDGIYLSVERSSHEIQPGCLATVFIVTFSQLGGSGKYRYRQRQTQTDTFCCFSESKLMVICRWRNNSLFAGIFELASWALRDCFFRKFSSVRASSACTGEGHKEKAAAAGLFVKERGDGNIMI